MNNIKKISYKNLFYIIIGLILLSINLIIPHSDAKEARKTLELNNYKVIEVGGYYWGFGFKEDYSKTKFKAINSKGEIINGYVAKGIFEKRSTIKFIDNY